MPLTTSTVSAKPRVKRRSDSPLTATLLQHQSVIVPARPSVPITTLENFRADNYTLPTTFGFELEVNMAPGSTHWTWDQPPGFDVGTDHCGYEARSKVFTNWAGLKQAAGLIDAYRKVGVNGTRNCGMHIHVGRAGLGDWVMDSKYHTCLASFMDFWLSIVPAHRLNNSYCSTPHIGSYKQWAKAVLEHVIPGWISPATATLHPAVNESFMVGCPAYSVRMRPRTMDELTAWFKALDHHKAPSLELCKAYPIHRDPAAPSNVISPERSATLAYTPPVPYDSTNFTHYNNHASWIRPQGAFDTLEVRLFHSSLSKTEVFANICSLLLFTEKFKENPEAMLTFCKGYLEKLVANQFASDSGASRAERAEELHRFLMPDKTEPLARILEARRLARNKYLDLPDDYLATPAS